MLRFEFTIGRLAKTSLALMLCTVGLSKAATPFLDHFNNYMVVDIDFSKSSSAFPSRNFPTWNSPLATGVKYYDINELKDDASGCYELSSSGPLADDVVIYYKNTAGSWVTLSDDNGGNHQFLARYAVINHEDHFLRISPYSTVEPNCNNNNSGVTFTLTKVAADPYNTNTSDPSSCRLANIPYYRRGYNNDLPYTAP